MVLTIPEPGRTELIERPYPKLASGYVIIKNEIAPVCNEGARCFDRHQFEFFDDPNHLGHESVGTVEEVLPGSFFNVGDRVLAFQGERCGQCHACRNGLSVTHCDWNNPDIHGVDGSALHGIEKRTGSESGGFAMARYRLVPEINLFKIPDSLSFKYAAAGNCLLGVGYSNQEIMGVKPGHTVLIGGIGFIGLGHVAAALYRNATVIALVRNEYRIGIMKKMGVKYFINPEDPDWEEQVMALTYEGQGVDHAVDGSGAPYYQERLLKVVCQYGTVNFSGHTPDAKLELSPLDNIINLGLKMCGQHDVRYIDREGLVRCLMDEGVQKSIDAAVTHEFPMSRADEAFRVQQSGKCGKIYLYPQE